MQDLRHFAGRFVLAAAIGAAAAPASAQDGSFIDTEFDLAGYAVSSFPGARDTTLIRHIATGGAPGAALEVQTERPAGAHRSTHYFINPSFEHDTASSGAITAIDLHIDVYTAFEPAINFNRNGVNFLVMQGGSTYWYSSPLTTVPDRYLTASEDDLEAEDFVRVVDLATRSVDPNSHPDFASGTLRFGFVDGWTSTGTVAHTVTRRFDNFGVAITSVPEPATAWLLPIGLAALLWQRRRANPLGGTW